MKKKYEFTDETIEVEGHVLHRIKALKSFGGVEKGNLGGFIEKEENLSHYGDCWVYGNAKVYGDAEVHDNAKVYCDAVVADNAYVCDNAEIGGHAKVYGDAQVYDNAKVCDYAEVYSHAEVQGDTIVDNKAQIFGDAKVYGYAIVYGNAKVCGNAVVDGMAEICGDAVVKEMGDYMVFKNTWSSGRWFTWTRSNNMWKVGCFYGTGEELIKKAYTDNEMKGKCYEVIVKSINEILKIVNEFAPSK